jgi:hypothetical protein
LSCLVSIGIVEIGRRVGPGAAKRGSDRTPSALNNTFQQFTRGEYEPVRACGREGIVVVVTLRTTEMQSLKSALLDIDATGSASVAEEASRKGRCSAQAVPLCARSQIADALTAIVFQAEAIRLRNAYGSSTEAELNQSVRHIVSSAKRVWSILGDTHEATCICRRPPT